MHWSSEWAEQHYDITSTSLPAQPKPLSYPQSSRPGFSGYSDDISALGASNLLKRYAERYNLTPAYPEAGTFRRSDPPQDAWPLGHNPERLSELEGVKGSLAGPRSFTQQFNTGAIGQDYTSSYSGPHLYHKPTYLSQPAFALPPAYPPPAPGYTYVPCLTAPNTPSLLPSGMHTPTPLSGLLPDHGGQALKQSEDPQELPRNRKSAFDQSKTARVSPYAIRDNSDHPISDAIGNSSADLHNFKTDRFLPMPDLKVELEGKSSSLQPFETLYRDPEQYTFP